MPSKNSLKDLKIREKKALLETVILPVEQKPNRGKPGRKPKSLEKKESETVALKLTKAELTNLKNKSGLVPVATFVKEHLRNKTDLLS